MYFDNMHKKRAKKRNAVASTGTQEKDIPMIAVYSRVSRDETDLHFSYENQTKDYMKEITEDRKKRIEEFVKGLAAHKARRRFQCDDDMMFGDLEGFTGGERFDKNASPFHSESTTPNDHEQFGACENRKKSELMLRSLRWADPIDPEFDPMRPLCQCDPSSMKDNPDSGEVDR